MLGKTLTTGDGILHMAVIQKIQLRSRKVVISNRNLTFTGKKSLTVKL